MDIRAYYDNARSCFFIQVIRTEDSKRHILTESGWVEYVRFSADQPVTAIIDEDSFNSMISKFERKPEDTSGIKNHLDDMRMVVRHFCKGS